MSEPAIREMIDRLIAFPTVSRDSNLALIDYVADYLDGFGVKSNKVFDDTGKKANLYATVGPNVEDGVVLSGHTDVVPVDGQPWSTDPFVIDERDGKLFGRGTCDMKTFYAIALALLPEMKDLKKPIHFALSYDEEIGCLGAPRMIEEIAAQVPRPRAVIVGEPTNMQVVTAHKGMTMIRTTVTGHEAHSSQTHRGVSAVMTAAKCIEKISSMAKERMTADTVEADFEPPYTTIHVGMISGGTASNIISRNCEFVWDIRPVPGDNALTFVKQFDEWCQTQVVPEMKAVNDNAGIESVVLDSVPGLRHDPETAAEQLSKQLTGNYETGKVPYATEAGQFQDAGFDVVICGPGSIDQAHQPDEFISLEQVEAGTKFIRGLIQELS